MSSTDDPATTTIDSDVEALRAEVASLHKELAEAKQRITALEDRLENGSTLPPGAADHRDARVLEAIEPGDVVQLRTLRSLYEDRTDIRDEETLRERIKDLTRRDAFELVGRQHWQYLGGEADR
ncbi:hypothetical protein [Halorhabdus amylolytica]|uniref:hypothetical protein n=1 Tax=Halorhabdus amylolytica TaxID=2559573 RepID=UPI0010AA093E|nr:hypothetical protein [Halorhabdus amylolytica]